MKLKEKIIVTIPDVLGDSTQFSNEDLCKYTQYLLESTPPVLEYAVYQKLLENDFGSTFIAETLVEVKDKSFKVVVKEIYDSYPSMDMYKSKKQFVKFILTLNKKAKKIQNIFNQGG